MAAHDNCTITGLTKMLLLLFAVVSLVNGASLPFSSSPSPSFSSSLVPSSSRPPPAPKPLTEHRAIEQLFKEVTMQDAHTRPNMGVPMRFDEREESGAYLGGWGRPLSPLRSGGAGAPSCSCVSKFESCEDAVVEMQGIVCPPIQRYCCKKEEKEETQNEDKEEEEEEKEEKTYLSAPRVHEKESHAGTYTLLRDEVAELMVPFSSFSSPDHTTERGENKNEEGEREGEEGGEQDTNGEEGKVREGEDAEEDGGKTREEGEKRETREGVEIEGGEEGNTKKEKPAPYIRPSTLGAILRLFTEGFKFLSNFF